MTTAPPRPDTQSKPKKGPYFSQAVARALDALEILKKATEPLSLQQITTSLGGAKASVFRLLYTLESVGYVTRDENACFLLSADVRASIPRQFIHPLVAAAQPVLSELARDLRESTSLAALFDNHIEVVAVAESPQVIRMSNTVGRILQPHASSLGKSIAAFQPQERRDHLLRSYGIYRYTPKTITDEMELRAEFDQIRQNGFAAEREETHLQGCCYGVPLVDEDGCAFAAMSVSMPLMRLEGPEQEERLVSRLKQAAAMVLQVARA